MPIPKHDNIRLPAMQLMQRVGTPMKLKEFEKPLAEHFKLTEAELSQMYDSGNGPIFYDRISWALSYLNMAGLVNKPKRATYELSPKGVEMLQMPDEINDYIKKEVFQTNATKKTKADQAILSEDPDDGTPQEQLYRSYENIRQSIYNEIIDTILSKSPYEFEKLVVTLLKRMGYGGEIKDSGMVTQASNDQGIDGIIKEDVLGLGRIYIQAKRYARDNSVGREEIQKFVGALAVVQSSKGVFITTSRYSKGGIRYAESLSGATSLVLIDGQQLAKYIYDYGFGMQVEQVIEIKKLDSDYWDTMQDDVR